MTMEETRTRLQTIVLLALAVMVVGCGVLTAVSHCWFRGVVFADALLRVEAAPEGAVYAGKVRGDRVSVAVAREGDSAVRVTYRAAEREDDYLLEYPLPPIQTERGAVDGIRVWKNGALLYQGGYDPEAPFGGWFNAQGEWDPGITFSVGPPEGAPAELDRQDVLYFALGPETAARGSWILYGLMVFLSVLVMLDAAFPRTLFRLRYRWGVRDPEPSDFYLAMQRLGWVVFPCLLLIGYAVALWQLP